ncbi:ABC transporter permease subunit, partial [Streptococcus anginosus]|nr:ABC transporter permease [Streptococcus anginosus]
LVVFWFIMKKTVTGFEIKAVGLNPFASRYAGMSAKKNIIISMLLSGAFAGLGGVVQGLGTYQNYFTQTTSVDIGFDGMSVSLL